MAENITVKDNAGAHQFEAVVDGATAYVSYVLNGDQITYEHTVVPQELEGRGIGGQLAKAVLDDARTRGRTVVPHCSFIAGYIRRHPDYIDIVDPDSRAAVQ